MDVLGRESARGEGRRGRRRGRRPPGNLPILSCPDGIPDGLVELGSVPHPERTERLFFGYDGTDAETGTLRTGVWYRSRPILPLMLLVR